MSIAKISCIYCGDKENITESDIIPDFLTNGKLRRSNVCKSCNEKCSKRFESKVSDDLRDITNHLDIKNSKSGKIPYSIATIDIEGTLFSKKITTKSDFFRGVATGERGLEKYQFGLVDGFKKRKNFIEEKLELFRNEMEVTRHFKFSENVFRSNEMLRMVAKICYEYYCRVNSVDVYQEEYKEIRDFIIDNKINKPTYADLIEIVVDSSLYENIHAAADIGGHAFSIGKEAYGREFVVFSLFGLVIYKVYLKQQPNYPFLLNELGDIFIIRADGSRTNARTITGSLYKVKSKIPYLGLREVFSESAKYYELMMKTRYMSLRVMKKYMDRVYELASTPTTEAQFDALLGYKDERLLFASLVLMKFQEKKEIIDFEMDYNSNLKEILETKEIYSINLNKTFEMLSEKYYSGELVKKVIEGYAIFCKFYEKEV